MILTDEKDSSLQCYASLNGFIKKNPEHRKGFFASLRFTQNDSLFMGHREGSSGDPFHLLKSRNFFGSPLLPSPSLPQRLTVILNEVKDLFNSCRTIVRVSLKLSLTWSQSPLITTYICYNQFHPDAYLVISSSKN